MEFWLTLLSSGAFSTTLAAILIYLSKSVIGVRIEQSIRHEYDVKLAEFKANAEHRNQLAIERLRSDFVALQSTQTTAFKALSEGQRISHSRTLDAISALWSEIVALKTNIPAVYVNMDILLENEYSMLLERDEQRELVSETVRLFFVNDVNEVAVQNARLFAGEELYAVFFSYRQILGRILIQLKNGLEQGSLECWYEERGMKSIMDVTFSEDELSLIRRNKLNTLNIALSMLEKRFLTSAANVHSGRNAALDTVNSADEIMRIGRALEVENARSSGSSRSE